MREKSSVHEDETGADDASYWYLSSSRCDFNEHSNLAFSLRDVHVYRFFQYFAGSVRLLGGEVMINDPIFIS
jgi:hypothetical protein